MGKLSVVISAYNEELKINKCLESVKKIADEIIFVDNSSTDKTLEIAKKYTSKIFVRENHKVLNINKNFGISKAEGDWVLYLDADEEVTRELKDELKSISSHDSEIDGYRIPRKNIL
ncbi:MAG: glycosyltransferase family 2 protein, partial [Nanoarchaeota archaeon]|nr:glycosyltransferase family 2 protein [Nanoarchaeota archaeon]